MSPRSGFVTLLAWTIIVLSTLLLPISFVSCLMVATRSYGTASADPIGFVFIVLGPLSTLVAGVGLLRRRRWALVYLALVFFGLVVTNGFNLARNSSAPRSYLSPGGVPTTVIPAGRTYVIQTSLLIAICAGMLVTLLSRRVRAECGFGGDRSPGNAPPDREPGWRVGHRGRDCMYYEEWRDGAWQRIEISGEMLMGRAHHVIYFASPQRWLEYPEWARYRRDEIITRIKRQFHPPDYEYHGDDAETPPAPPPAAAPKSNARPNHGAAAGRRAGSRRPGAALILTVGLLLGLTAGLGWLVGRSVSAGETFFPSKRTTQRRVVVRQEEPVTFWMSLGFYSVIGAGTLGGAAWLLRESLRQRPLSAGLRK